MAKPKLTLWLLNRVVGWDRDLLVATLMDRFEVKLGRRVRKGGTAPQELQTLDLPVNDGEDGAPGELMHEGAALGGAITGYDEYFLPIPPQVRVTCSPS